MERLKVGGKTQAQVDAAREAEEQQAISDASLAYLRQTDEKVTKAAERYLVEQGYLTEEFGKLRDDARERVEHEEKS